MEKINVALVGVGFGGAFVDIYKHHPNVGEISLFDTDSIKLSKFSQKYSLKVHSSFEEILMDERRYPGRCECQFDPFARLN